MVKTKIIATLGPASSKPSVLLNMIRAGLDVVRLNFSHGTHEESARRIALVRALNKRYRRSIKILGDLEGPRIRIGELKNPLLLKKNAIVRLAKAVSSGIDAIPFDYQGSLKDIKTGNYIYIDDGNIVLRAKAHSGNFLEAQVIIGGQLKQHKGINIPEAALRFEELSGQDKEDIIFCLEQGVDYIAQSFVRGKNDILAIREFIASCVRNRRLNHLSAKLVAKIENKEGIAHIGDILRVSDGIMIARGDMGVCLPIYQVPVMQKEIIKKCKASGKFVITATQMLESMTENIRPTRAEVSDVANAIFDGSDFVMLSAETAVGKYPVETVTMMNQIIKFTEAHLKALPAKCR